VGLDIYFFNKGFDIQKSRADIDATYTKLQAVKAELKGTDYSYCYEENE
jgi:hypothetical protein